MINKIAWTTMVIALVLTACANRGEEPVDVSIIDGIKHINNPPEPIKGTITLELEKIREINPYEIDSVGMKNFFAARSPDGDVILFDPNNVEAHGFGPDNSYLGSMVKKGQGPAEFQPYHGLNFFFWDDQIWASSSQKVVRYDRRGTYLEEYKIGSARGSPDYFLDRNRYLCEKSLWTDTEQTRKVCVEPLRGEDSAEGSIVLYEVTRTDWLVRRGRSAFSDSWSCPSLLYTYIPEQETIYYALSDEYKIYAKDTSGNLKHIIEKPHQPVKVGPREKEILAGWALGRESSRWILDAYPDTLNALLALKALPNGHLAAFRISGPKEVALDVFDIKGRWIYALEMPGSDHLKTILAAEKQIGFFESGLFTQETREDLPVYIEYRVANLPDIFH